MTMLTEGMTSSASKEWMTPDSEFVPLNEVWGFTLDGAASHLNAMVPRYCTADGTFEWQVERSTSLSEMIETGRRTEWIAARDSIGNAKAEVRQISPADGLKYPWDDEIVWLNPPWGDPENVCDQQTCKLKRCKERGFHTERYVPGVEDFLRKTRNEVLRHRATVVALLPARTDTGWFHTYVLPYARTIRWGKGRIKFINPETMEVGTAPPVGTFVAVFR